MSWYAIKPTLFGTRIGYKVMPVTQDKPAPYAPTSVILNLLVRHRDRGLPTPVTPDVLARAGVTDSLNARTLQALQVLDLIDEEGRPTPVLEGLRLAPEAEYKARMGEWLTSAYADALKFIDPATATETQIHDAFRSYRPPGMRDRMVTLFLGLFEAAGIAPERKRKSSPKPINGSAARTVKPTSATPPPKQPGQTSQQLHRQDHRITGLPPPIAGLLASLPQDGGTWTKHDRDKFVHTFEAVLDFCYPVTTGARQKVQFLEGDNENNT